MPTFFKGAAGGGRASSSLVSNMFGPRQLLQQILVMQSIYYLIGFILILFTCIVSGEPFSLKVVFSWEPVRIDTTMGWTLFMLWLLDTFFSVLALTVVVGRSKLALDFTLTLHGIHLVVCWAVAGKFPASKLWWGLQLASILLMALLGTWTTQWRELRATFFDPEAGHTPVAPSVSRPLVASQDHYDDFELQDTPESPALAQTPPALAGQTSKLPSAPPLDENYDSEDDTGDLTAGSKLLRDTGKRY